MRTSWLRLAVVGVLLAGVGAVPAGGREEPPTLRELITSQNNLKQIALAYHNAHDTNDKFPDDVRDADGKPLLSWRVAILPFIEENELYMQFKLDEAWDSAGNKKLIEKLPKVYAPVHVKAKAGETYYQRFVGKDAVFGEKGPQYKLVGITDGTSNTAMLVEAGDPVIWTKPADLPFDKDKPLPKLGGMFEGTFHMALCDGSVRRVRKNFDADLMKKIIMPADGDVVDFDKLSK